MGLIVDRQVLRKRKKFEISKRKVFGLFDILNNCLMGLGHFRLVKMNVNKSGCGKLFVSVDKKLNDKLES